MKKLILLLMLATGILSGFSQKIDYEKAENVAKFTIYQNGQKLTHNLSGNYKEVKNPVNDLSLFYVFDLEPTGFIIVTCHDELYPVWAYSFENEYSDSKSSNPLERLLISDISFRLQNSNLVSTTEKNKIKELWNNALSADPVMKGVMYWPPTGTTSTGGWLESNWHQSAPYNNFCPQDLVTNSRSIAGCPAVAMGQVVNFLRTINGTTFSDIDDYYHNYGNGRRFWIDDDYVAHDFPSFPELNIYLDTVANHFTSGTALTNQDKAALTFACGVAALQIFSSEVSGTFSVQQAYTAYQKFGFTESILLYPSQKEIYLHMALNIRHGLPTHYAMVDPGDSYGHNVVADGWNDNNYFHLNFGWGGSSNAWYIIPNQLPMGMTVTEGTVMDIYTEKPSNNIPTCSDVEIPAVFNTSIFLNDTAFADRFNDNDFDVLYKIKIENLPAHGTLKIDNSPVAVGQEISVFDLNLIEYTPDLDWTGTEIIDFYVSDGWDYSTTINHLNIVVYNPLSISNKNDNQLISIYPNPTEKLLYINFDKSIDGNIKLKIVNMMGSNQLLLDYNTIVNNTIAIDVKNLIPGIYCIYIENGTKSIVRQFVKM